MLWMSLIVILLLLLKLQVLLQLLLALLQVLGHQWHMNFVIPFCFTSVHDGCEDFALRIVGRWRLLGNLIVLVAEQVFLFLLLTKDGMLKRLLVVQVIILCMLVLPGIDVDWKVTRIALNMGRLDNVVSLV
jgi:hypothetical protein